MPILLLEHPGLMLSIALLLSLLITAVVIPVVVRVAREKHLMEEPNGRSSHWQKTPSLGGVAIFAAVAIVFTVIAQWASPTNTALFQVLPSIVILFFIGLKDDILVIDPVKKLIAQLIASGMFIFLTDIRISDLHGVLGIFELPYGISFGLTLFIFVVITNAYNLIDGIDGLAGCLGIVATTIYGFYYALADVVWMAILCATLVGALSGFLWFNFSRTQKIFMGDSGSLVVGFILAVLSIKFIQFNEGHNVLYIHNAPTIAIAILGIPLFDTLRVFGHRLVRGISPFSADRNHIHHLLVERGLSHGKTSLWLSAISVVAIGLCFTFVRQSSIAYSLIGVLLAFVIYALIVRRRFLVGKSKMYVQKRITPANTTTTVTTQKFTRPQSASAAS
jgi:UDP-N-acetylmuramyl pentapeptide phosphotransferase/UDP-N-acetylglucosamine-1-phosphate transferase